MGTGVLYGYRDTLWVPGYFMGTGLLYGYRDTLWVPVYFMSTGILCGYRDTLWVPGCFMGTGILYGYRVLYGYRGTLWALGYFLGLKAAGHEIAHSPQLCRRLRMSGAIPSPSLYAFMWWRRTTLRVVIDQIEFHENPSIDVEIRVEIYLLVLVTCDCHWANFHETRTWAITFFVNISCNGSYKYPKKCAAALTLGARQKDGRTVRRGLHIIFYLVKSA